MGYDSLIEFVLFCYSLNIAALHMQNFIYIPSTSFIYLVVSSKILIIAVILQYIMCAIVYAPHTPAPIIFLTIHPPGILDLAGKEEKH
jgi:hypothetical protein